MSHKSLTYSVALIAVIAGSVLSPLAPWSAANAASSCTSRTCPPPTDSSSSSSSSESSSSSDSSSSSTPHGDGGSDDTGTTDDGGLPGNGGTPGNGNSVEQVLVIACDIPDIALALRFRNVGDHVIDEGSRVTWRIAETGEHGTLLLPVRLAPGEKVAITDLLRHVVTAQDHCQARLAM